MTEQVQELPAVVPAEEAGSSAFKAFAVNVAKRLVPWLVPVGLIVFWQIASALGGDNTPELPAPHHRGKAEGKHTVYGELW